MVKHNNQWGTVCDDYVHVEENPSKSARVAQSACHTLGLSGGVIEPYDGQTKGPDGPIWMDETDCATSTTNFLSCSHAGWGEQNCGHGEDVLLTCT